MKTVLRVIVFGGLLGGVLTSWIAPAVIAWYFKPPAQVEFSCVGPIEWALSRMRYAQLGGIGIGAILAIVAYGFYRKLFPNQEVRAIKA